MNAPRRKNLSKIIAAIEELKSQLDDQNTELEDLNDDEQTAFSNLPENLEGSERYERAEAAAMAMEEAMEALSEALDQLDSCIEAIQEAIDA